MIWEVVTKGDPLARALAVEPRVLLLDEWHDLFDEIGLLPDRLVGRMVCVPRKMSKRRRDTDQAELVMQIMTLDFSQSIAVSMFIVRFHRQNVKDGVLPTWFQCSGEKNIDFRWTCLELRLPAMNPPSFG